MEPRKTIFITGAGSGIGQAAALRFPRVGWFVGLYDLNGPAVEALQKQLGEDNSCARPLDVTDAADVKAALAHFLDHGGARLDALFNCAGVLYTGPFEEISLEQHQRTIEVNAKGVMHCCHLALPALQATPGSCVVNMCSASSFFGSPDHVVYSATKFFVRGFTEALNIEWSRFGIRVCDIMPPYVDTPMIEGARKITAMKSLGVRMTPELVAQVVWKAVHGSRLHWTVGRQAAGLFLASRLAPLSIVRYTTKKTTGY